MDSNFTNEFNDTSDGNFTDYPMYGQILHGFRGYYWFIHGYLAIGKYSLFLFFSFFFCLSLSLWLIRFFTIDDSQFLPFDSCLCLWNDCQHFKYNRFDQVCELYEISRIFWINLGIFLFSHRKNMVSPTNSILTGLAVADMLVMIDYVSYAFYDTKL